MRSEVESAARRAQDHDHGHGRRHVRTLYNQGNPFAQPVSVTFANQNRPDASELRRMGTRALNLNLLLKTLFDGSIAALSARLEIAPDRLRALVEMQAPFGAEIAEHLERSLNLPGGWLDQRHNHIEADQLRSVIFRPAEEDKETEDAGPSRPSDATSVRQAPDEQPGDEAPKVAQPVTNEASDQGVNRIDDPVAQVLRWLNDEIKRLRAPESVRARAALRTYLGRAQSTLSTWFNGLRRLPDDMAVPVVQAVIKARLPFAGEFMERMFKAAPEIFTPSIRQSLRDMYDMFKQHSSAHDQEQPEQEPIPEWCTEPEERETFRRLSVALQTLEQEFGKFSKKNRPSKEEVSLAIARTAEKITDVLQCILQNNRG